MIEIELIQPPHRQLRCNSRKSARGRELLLYRASGTFFIVPVPLTTPGPMAGSDSDNINECLLSGRHLYYYVGGAVAKGVSLV